MIDIVHQPSQYSPVRNEIIYVLSGGSYNNFGHQYLVDLYSAGTNVLLKPFEVPHVPNTVFGVLDISKVLGDYVRPNRDINSLASPYFLAPNSFIDYYVLIGEQYDRWNYDDYTFNGGRVVFSSTTQRHGLSIGDEIYVNQTVPFTHQEYQGLQVVYAVLDEYGIVVDETFQAGPTEPGVIARKDGTPLRFSGLTTGSTLTAFNTAIEYDDFVSYTSSTYVYNFTADTKALSTNAPPDDWNMRLNSHMFLYMPQFSATTIFAYNQVGVATYNEAGESIGLYFITHSAQTSRDAFYFGIGPKDLANSPQFSVFSGLSTIINSSVAYYDVYPYSLPPSQGETQRIYLDRTCLKHELFDILFMDKLGTWNTFSFYLRPDKKVVIKKDLYHKSKGNLIAGQWSNQHKDAGLTIYNVDSSREFVIRTELFNEGCSDYIEQLLESPYVYRVVDDRLIPIIVRDGTYTILSDSDKVFQYELTIAYANYRNNLI